MPKINTTPSSCSSAPSSEQPPKRFRRSSSSRTYASHHDMPRIDRRISRTRNVPKSLLLPAKGSPSSCAQGPAATPSCAKAGRPWDVSAMLIPNLSPDDNPANRARLHAVLTAISIVNSDYWKGPLSAFSLCLRDGRREILCLVRPADDYNITVPGRCALIQMTSGPPEKSEPLAYCSGLERTMPNVFPEEPFFSAAVQAALLLLPPLTDFSPENYQAVVGSHISSLRDSVGAWLADHQCCLKKAGTRILQAGQATT